MACAQCRQGLDDTGGEAHHQERGLNGRPFCRSWVGGRRSRRSRGTHEKVTVMCFVQSDRVRLGGVECGVGASDKSPTDGDLGSQTDDCTGDV